MNKFDFSKGQITFQEGKYGNIYLTQKGDQILAKEPLTKSNILFSEIKGLTSLYHPASLKLQYVSSKDSNEFGQDYLVTDYENIKNNNLEKIISQNEPSFTLLHKMELAYGVIDLLLYVQYFTRLHFDLKPSEIYLDGEFHPHVTGFYYVMNPSIRKNYQEIVKNGIYNYQKVINTIYEANEASESVFKYGILISEVFSGQIIKSAEFTDEEVDQMTKDIPGNLKEIVVSCLNKEKSKRPEISEVIDGLRNIKNMPTDFDIEKYESYIKSIDEFHHIFCINRTAKNQVDIADFVNLLHEREDFQDVRDTNSTISSAYSQTNDKKNRGTFGTVVPVEFDGNSYALKTMIQEGDKDFQQNYFREVTLIMGGSHLFALSLYGFNMIKLSDEKHDFVVKEPFIVMTREKGSLSSQLDSCTGKNYRKNNFTDIIKEDKNLILIISYGILRVFNYYHQKRLYHRDIKPENILLDEKNYPHICDYGLAKWKNTDSNSFISRDVGTPLYVAPELHRISNIFNIYTNKQDIFSVGLVLFEVLEGMRYYHSKNINYRKGMDVKTIKENVSNNLEFSENAPEAIKNAIESMVDTNESERPDLSEVCKIYEDPSNWGEMGNEFNWKEFFELKEKIDKDEHERFNQYISKMTYSWGETNEKCLAEVFDESNPEIFRMKNYEYLLELANYELKTYVGSTTALCALSQIYFKGAPGIPRNAALALKYANNALKLNPEDEWSNGLFSLLQNEISKIERREIVDLKKEEIHDFTSGRSLFLIGLFHESFDEMSLALKYYTRGASFGCREAAGRAAILLLVNGPNNLERAKKLFLFAENNDVWRNNDASHSLFIFPRDEALLRKYYLALSYMKSTKEEAIKAKVLFEELSKEGFPNAETFLSLGYFTL